MIFYVEVSLKNTDSCRQHEIVVEASNNIEAITIAKATPEVTLVTSIRTRPDPTCVRYTPQVQR